MPAPPQFPSLPAFPALHLYPLNDTFIPKHIILTNNQRVKIGRQTNAKTVPAERNGFFDSKVLSRQHAEIWEENSKIFIKDVKSSNGTFINGERLSPEGVESEPFPLKNEDIVEFGIDIVGEDNKTTIHHKVAARVFCVFSEEDAQAAARFEHMQSAGGLVSMSAQTSSGNGSTTFSFSQSQNGPPSSAQRRGTIQSQGLGGMGGMGGSMRVPGKSGLTFDHILSRLQGELQKSRETGSELQHLNSAMNDIRDTLGGSLPPYPPHYPSTLPSVRSPAQNQGQPQGQGQGEPSVPAPASAPPLAPTIAADPAPGSSTTVPASALSELQAQLHETQTSLASHVDKVRSLEGMLAEHEAIKREMGALRGMMEMRRREMEMGGDAGPRIHIREADHEHGRGQNGIDELQEYNNAQDHSGTASHLQNGIYRSADEDDTRSIRTVVPHELERVDEEDEDQLTVEGEQIEEQDEDEDEERRRRRREELGRPRTPEPGMGMDHDHDRDEIRREEREMRSDERGEEGPSSSLQHSQQSEPESEPEHSSEASLQHQQEHLPQEQSNAIKSFVVTDDLTQRLAELASQLESALVFTSAMQAQHVAAQATISQLSSKVASLESMMQATQAQVQEQAARAQTAESASEPQHGDSQAEPTRERERESLTEVLSDWKKSVEGQWSAVREEWSQERERLNRAREEWEGRVRALELGVDERVSAGVASLVTLRGSHYPPNGDAKGQTNGLVTPPSPESIASDAGKTKAKRRRSSSSRGRSRSVSPISPIAATSREGLSSHEDGVHAHSSSDSNPACRPHEGSARRYSRSTSPSTADDTGSEVDSSASKNNNGTQYPITPEPSVRESSAPPLPTSLDVMSKAAVSPTSSDMHFTHMSTAIGVLVLGVAAAAVLWRVKPE